MKIIDLDESTLNEFIPLTKRGRALRKVEKKGAADMQASVDNLKNEFGSYLGAQGKRVKKATTDDVIAFLKTKNVDTSDIGTSDPMTPQRLDNIFKVKIQKKMAGQQVTPKQDTAPSDDKVTSSPKTSNYTQAKKLAIGLNAKEKRRLADQLLKSIKTR